MNNTLEIIKKIETAIAKVEKAKYAATIDKIAKKLAEETGIEELNSTAGLSNENVKDIFSWKQEVFYQHADYVLEDLRS